MLPVGMLMLEHRLIERVVKLWEKELDCIAAQAKANTFFLDQGIDFMRTYADHFHHGKEEDILFRDLRKKPLTAPHKQVLDRLLEEHKTARRTVATLAAARQNYAAGATDALSAITQSVTTIAQLYPAHIRTEDKEFFLPIMEYFTQQEKEKMLADFRAFEPQLHEKYRSMVFAMERA